MLGGGGGGVGQCEKEGFKGRGQGLANFLSNGTGSKYHCLAPLRFLWGLLKSDA